MNECRRIEPLLFLFRDGELSPEELREVQRHIDVCFRCREVLQQLRSVDAALAPLREEVPDSVGSIDAINRTMDQLAGQHKRMGERNQSVLLDWLRPALSWMVMAAVVLLLTQQVRDAVKIADLEKRLGARGNVVASSGSALNPGVLRFLTGESIDRRSGIAAAPSLKDASTASDPMQLIPSGILSLFQRNSTLFDELSRRYPNLSTITLDDGIDERERKILATEGAVFLREFKQLLQEGEK